MPGAKPKGMTDIQRRALKMDRLRRELAKELARDKAEPAKDGMLICERWNQRARKREQMPPPFMPPVPPPHQRSYPGSYWPWMIEKLNRSAWIYD